ncbi:MAG: phosphoribosylformylglycinamidine synthase subunit PurS [Endomicrobium sp.]|jgi:phosphoribosylformylglycinamidine synthase|nr:phosphoribosylformylglycinamidine synthase subunit PurS [Endomicrobium sp.]
MFCIEVFTKNEFKDSRGEHVLSDIISLDFNCVNKVEYCSLYLIDGKLFLKEVKLIASCLLSDKITESYSITKYDTENPSYLFNNNVVTSKAVIDVLYKKGVTDTVSASVIKAVKDLGINKNIEVKTGHRYYLYGKLSKTILDGIACKLLSNTLIQEYKVNGLK